jgi:hypothetical protein
VFGFPIALLAANSQKSAPKPAPEPVPEPAPLQTIGAPMSPALAQCRADEGPSLQRPDSGELFTPWADHSAGPDEDMQTLAPPAPIRGPLDMWSEAPWLSMPTALSNGPNAATNAFNTAISPVMDFEAGKKASTRVLAEDRIGDDTNYNTVQLGSGTGLAGQQFKLEDQYTEGSLTSVTKLGAKKDGTFNSLSYESSQEEAADGPGAGQNSRSLKVGGAFGPEGVKGELERSVGAGNGTLGYSGKFDTSNGSFQVGGTVGGTTTNLGRGESGGFTVDQSFKMFKDEQGKAYNSFGWSLDPAAGRYGVNFGNERWNLGAGVLENGGYFNFGTKKGGFGLAAQLGDTTNISAQGAVGDLFSASAGVSIGEDMVSANLGGKYAGFGLKTSGTWINDRTDAQILSGAPGKDSIAETSVTNGFDGSIGGSIPFFEMGGGGGHSDVVRHRQKLPGWLGALPGPFGVAAQSAWLAQQKEQAKDGPDAISEVDVTSMADGEGYSFDHDGHESINASLGADILIASAKIEAKQETGRTEGTDIDRSGDEYTVGARSSEYEKQTLSAGLDITIADIEDKVTTVEVNGQAVQWSAKGPEAAQQVQRFVETGLIPGADKAEGMLSTLFLDDFQEKDREVKALEALQRDIKMGEIRGFAMPTLGDFVLGPLEEARAARRRAAEMLNAGLLAGTNVGEELSPGVMLKSREDSELRQREEKGSAGLLWWETEWTNEDSEEKRQRRTVDKNGEEAITDQRRERHDDDEGDAEQLAVEISSAEDKAALSFVSRERFEDPSAQLVKPILPKDGIFNPFANDVVETNSDGTDNKSAPSDDLTARPGSACNRVRAGQYGHAGEGRRQPGCAARADQVLLQGEWVQARTLGAG